MSAKVSPPRNKLASAAIALGVIAIGLGSRKYPALFPALLGKYPGDALWALMVFMGWCILLPCARTRILAACALGTSFAIEFSQLYQAPWINAVRHHPIGHLVLGSTFSWIDLVAYVAGIALGVGGDRWMQAIRDRSALTRKIIP